MTLTREYREFVETVASGITYELPFEGYVEIELILYMPGTKDTDGPIKGIMDAIEKSGIIENDNKVTNLNVVRYFSPQKDQGFEITIKDAIRVDMGFAAQA